MCEFIKIKLPCDVCGAIYDTFITVEELDNPVDESPNKCSDCSFKIQQSLQPTKHILH